MRSGLQNQVLQLYKGFLREISRKDTQVQEKFKLYIKKEFLARKDIPRKDIDSIEYYLRLGRKQLEIFKDKSVTDISL
jgi:succinate dehydrogenase assembly factor 1